eukprot:Gb_19414 [translate_table: standard]
MSLGTISRVLYLAICISSDIGVALDKEMSGNREQDDEMLSCSRTGAIIDWNLEQARCCKWEMPGGRSLEFIGRRTMKWEVIARVAKDDLEYVNNTVNAARKAFDEGPWPRITAYERSCIMYYFDRFVEKHNEEIATLET